MKYLVKETTTYVDGKVEESKQVGQIKAVDDYSADFELAKSKEKVNTAKKAAKMTVTVYTETTEAKKIAQDKKAEKDNPAAAKEAPKKKSTKKVVKPTAESEEEEEDEDLLGEAAEKTKTKKSPIIEG